MTNERKPKCGECADAIPCKSGLESSGRTFDPSLDANPDCFAFDSLKPTPADPSPEVVERVARAIRASVRETTCAYLDGLEAEHAAKEKADGELATEREVIATMHSNLTKADAALAASRECIERLNAKARQLEKDNDAARAEVVSLTAELTDHIEGTEGVRRVVKKMLACDVCGSCCDAKCRALIAAATKEG